MSTHALNWRAQRHVSVRLGLSRHWAWLAWGFALAFAVPFLFADLLEINRDLLYGLCAIAVFGLIGLSTRSTGSDLVATIKRRWVWAVVLGGVFALREVAPQLPQTLVRPLVDLEDEHLAQAAEPGEARPKDLRSAFAIRERRVRQFHSRLPASAPMALTVSGGRNQVGRIRRLLGRRF